MNKILLKLTFVSLFVFQCSLINASEGNVCILIGHSEETATFMNLFANDQGLLKQANLKLKIINNNQREIVTKSFSDRKNSKLKNLSLKKTNDCDFTLLSFDSLITSNSEFINSNKLLYSSFYGVNYDTHFIVKKNSNIKSLKDLANKKVRLGHLGTMLAFKNMMEQEKLTTDSVKLYTLDPVSIVEALKTNQIAMATSYFPTMQVALASGEVEILKKNIFGTYLNTPYPQSIILVNKNTIEKKPELVKSYKEVMNNVFNVTAKSPMVLAKTLRLHTKELGVQPWKVSDAQIEKGEEQYSAINLITENEPVTYKNQKMLPKEIFSKMVAEFKSANFIKNDIDLSPLF